jgi:putative transposase
MGKLEARAVDKRIPFVAAVDAGEETVTALCWRFGFSRKTGDKWLEGYRLEGIEGLVERSRRHAPMPRR